MFGAPAYALAPPNDNLANALLLTPRGGEAFITGTNSEATVQQLEPSSPVGPYKSVWYRIAAPVAGTTLDITTDGSSFDTTLVVYRGNPAGGFLKLSYVDDDDDGGDVGRGSRITAMVPDSSGLDYLIAVDGFGAASGNIVLTANVTPPPPANDNFANSQLITVPTGGVTVSGNNLGATRQTGEPTDHGDEKSVWYRIDPAAVGKGIRITSAGSELDASLAVYRGSYAAGVSALQLVDQGSFVSDDGESYERIEFVMPSGSSDSYFLALGSSDGGDDFTLNFRTFTAPTNDAFVNAHLVTVPNGGIVVSGSNADATMQTDEPTEHGDEKSLWYRVAPATVGNGIRITSAGSASDPNLALYRGTFAGGVSSLHLVESGRYIFTESGGYDQIDFLIPPGSSDSYFLALGSYGAGGGVQLNFTTFTAPANDAFANAQLVTVPAGGVTVQGTNQGATREINEPLTHGDKKSVWYRIAPSSVSRGIRITSAGSEFLPNFSVYRGSIAAGLSALQVVDVGASVVSGGVTHRQVDFVMPASPAEDYFFAAGTADLSGALQLNFTTFTAPANDLFANAQLVTVPTGGISVAGSTVGATRQTSEPTAHGNSKSVWYRIASSAAGKGILVTSLGSEYLPDIAVYRGSTATGITSLQLVETASSVFAPSGSYERVDFVIPTGTSETYFVAVGSFGARGGIQLNFTTFTAPSNDMFANAQSVTVPTGGVSVSGSNLGATKETNEPSNHGSRKSVWYRIDPAAAGKGVLITSAGSELSPELAVYRGSAAAGLAALQPVTSGSQQVNFLMPTSTSDTFFLAVGSYSSAGLLQLNFSTFLPPANDTLAGAAPINVTFGNGTVAGTLFGATADDPEDASRSVWYRMITPPDGSRLLVSGNGSSFKVFIGNPANGFSSLIPVDGPYDSGFAFNRTLGPSEVYLIRVSGSADAFEFRVVAPPTLIITGVIDGPLPGGLPKAVELYALEDIPNLGAYWVGVANDGGGTDGPEVNLTGSLSKGEFYYVSNEAPKFQSFFGFAADLVSTNLSSNGNDAIELFYYPSGSTPGSQLTIDTFGEQGVNGSGRPWEYTGSWAYRNVATAPDLGTFVPSHWRYLGPGGLAGKTTNAPITATSFPLGTFLSGELLFPALASHPFERFAGGVDPFDLDHKTLTLVPVNASETDPDKWAYHYTVSEGAVPWLDLAALDPNSEPYSSDYEDNASFEYPVTFPFYGGLRSTLTVDGANLEFEGALPIISLPVPGGTYEYENSQRIGNIGGTTVIQSEWEITYLGFIYGPGPGPSRYQVELFPSGMIRISFHGVRSSSVELGITNGQMDQVEADFSAASLKFSPAVLQESAAGSPMVSLPRPQPSNLAYSLLTTPISAIPGEDYLVTSGSGIATSNGIATAIPLSILNDAFAEQDERIEVILRDPVDSAWILGRTDFWIIDNDATSQAANNPVLQIVGDVVRITPTPPLAPAGNYQVRIRGIQGGSVFGTDGRTLLEGALVSLAEAATGLRLSSSSVTFSVEFILVSNGSVVGKSYHRYTRTGTQPSFRFSGPSSVTVQEGTILSLPIELLDAGSLDDGTAYSVNHQLVPITATRFSANTGDFIVLPTEIQNGPRTIEIPIVADGVAEGNETFEVRLTNPSPGAILGTPAVVTVTIQGVAGLAADGTSPFVQLLPTNAKASTITLGIGTNDWRFAGDPFWSNGVKTLLVRRPGLFVTRYPNGESQTVLNGMPLQEGYSYQNIVLTDPHAEEGDGDVFTDNITVPGRIGSGSLQVVLEPTSGRWRRLGQTTWRSSGFTETSVQNGVQFVEFDNNVSNNFAPALLKVNVVSGTTTVTAKYQPKQSSAPTSTLSSLETTLDPSGYPKVADTTGPGVNESNDWINIPFTAQTGEFALICDVETDYLSVGSTVLIDSIVGLSSSANTDNWNEVSAVARAFRSEANGNHFWDSHTGGPSCSSNCFSRLDEVLILDDTKYRLRFLVNVPAKTFSVEVEFAGSEWITVVKNAPFRTSSASSLGYLTLRNVQGKIRLLAPPRVVPYPDHFTGRIESSRGFGSGTVVAKRAVLTSAEMVFNRANLSFYDDIVWRCSAGQSDVIPEVNEPSGAFLLTGYAEGLLAESVDSTIRDAQNVAVLGFIERIHPNLPGSGGYSGIRIDDGTGSWKTSGVAKRMPFYPFSSVSTENLGKMHFLDANSVTFTAQGQGVFTASSGFSPPPGAEGASLFVRMTNGTSLPAAVYLGSRSGVSYFRQIDERIAMAVRATASIEDQLLADGGHILFDQDSSKGGIYYIEAGIGERKDPDHGIIDAKDIPAGIVWRIQSKKENETYNGGSRIGVDPWFDYTLTFPAAPPAWVLDPLVLKDPVARTIKHVPVKGGTWTIPKVYLPDSTDYQSWKARNYTASEISASPTARWGVASTDMALFLGVENAVAYAFGFDPKAGATRYADPDSMTPGFPIVRRNASTGVVYFEFLRRKDANLRYDIETTTTLDGTWPKVDASWPKIPTSLEVVGSNVVWEHVRYPLTVSRKFARLRVSLAE